MRAFQFLATGDLSMNSNFAVQDVPIPVAGNGEVIVKVECAALHPVDYKVAGPLGAMLLTELPMTGGTDVAGVVTEVGPGVENIAVGDKVAGYTAVKRMEFGSFAEYCKLESSLAIPKPEDMSYEDASTLGVAFTTAITSCFPSDRLGLEPKQQTPEDAPWVAVLGGTSSVGQMAVQLLSSFGYKVLATASPRYFDWVKSLGASAVIDYHLDEEAAVAAVKDNAGGSLVKYVFDCVGSVKQGASFLAPNGRIISIAAFALPEDVTLPEGGYFSFQGIQDLHQSSEKDKLDLCDDLLHNYVAPKLADGTFKPNPVQLASPGGVDGVLEAIRLVEKGLSAKTLVIRIAE